MSQSNYYITLSSRSSSHYFENRPSNFKVNLAQPLELEGKWEAALTEITFQQSWKNMESDCNMHLWYRMNNMEGIKTAENAMELSDVYDILQKTNKTALMGGESYKLHKIMLSAGNYKTPADLLLELLKHAKQQDADVQGYYDRFGKRMRIRGPTAISMVKNKQLQNAFGLKDTIGQTAEIDVYDLPIKGVDCTMSVIPAIYVYGDVVEYSRVGDAMVPILRTVPVTGDSGDNVNQTFLRPYYIPVTRGYISAIEIHIASATGDEIRFEKGEVICVLHFRKCGLTL